MYLRLSRDDGDKLESESISNQRDFINDYIKKNDYILIQEYIDDGISGTTFERPGFKKMINDALSGKINTIITKDLSRLGRNNSKTSGYVEEFFPENNIRYIAILNGIDTEEDNVANKFASYLYVQNEQYAYDISEKVKAAINTKKRNGQFLGATAPYGYKKDPNNKYHLIIDEYSSQIVKRIFNMFINGYSLQRIADSLTNDKIPIPSVYKNLNRGMKSTAYGIWCTRTIDEMLNNPTYIGNLTQCRRKKKSFKLKKIVRNPKEKWIIVKNTHEPIIDTDTFNIVQELYHKNTNTNNNDVLLKGLLFCKECGHSIAISKNNNNKYYCQCNYYKKYSKRGLCTPHSCPYELLENSVLTEIRKLCKLCLNKRNLETIVNNNNKQHKLILEFKSKINKASIKLYSLTQKLDTTYDDRLNNIITIEQYKKTSNNLKNEIKEEKNLLYSLNKEYYYLLKNKKNIEDYTSIIKEYLEFKNPTKQLISSIIDKVLLDENKNIDIHLKIKSVY